MTTTMLIDPPVNYWADPVADVEAWLRELEALPEHPQITAEIERVNAALASRDSLADVAQEWGLI